MLHIHVTRTLGIFSRAPGTSFRRPEAEDTSGEAHEKPLAPRVRYTLIK